MWGKKWNCRWKESQRCFKEIRKVIKTLLSNELVLLDFIKEKRLNIHGSHQRKYEAQTVSAFAFIIISCFEVKHEFKRANDICFY